MKKLILIGLLLLSSSLVYYNNAMTVQGQLGAPIEASRSVAQLILNNVPASDPRYAKVQSAMTTLSQASGDAGEGPSNVQGQLGEPVEALRSVVQLALNSISATDPRYNNLKQAMSVLSQ